MEDDRSNYSSKKASSADPRSAEQGKDAETETRSESQKSERHNPEIRKHKSSEKCTTVEQVKKQ